MKRRGFLSFLGIGAVSAAIPKVMADQPAGGLELPEPVAEEMRNFVRTVFLTKEEVDRRFYQGTQWDDEVLRVANMDTAFCDGTAVIRPKTVVRSTHG